MPKSLQDELRLSLRNDLLELPAACAAAEAYLAQRGVEPWTRSVLALALEEVVSNVIRHGYDDGARHEIAVALRLVGEEVELDVVDDGREFDPRASPDVDLRAPLDARRAGGLGVHLLRTMVRELRYERVGDQNHLRVLVGAR